jgi:hypothetical protein
MAIMLIPSGGAQELGDPARDYIEDVSTSL